MSNVSDLVFITPGTDWDEEEYVNRCLRFEAMVTRYGYNCVPAQDHGSKVSDTAVYYVGGINYLDLDLVAEIKTAGWPRGTVLYVHHEQDSEPQVTVFGRQER